MCENVGGENNIKGVGRMTKKRFNVFDVDGTIFLEDHKEGSYHIGEIENVDMICLNDIASRLNELHEEKEQLAEENKELKSENEQLIYDLKRCRDWINSDKDDYELTLAFIKNKGYSLKDVLEYEKELNSE